MPETRYSYVYDKEGNIVETIPFEVSDEQLQDEADELLCLQYLAQSSPVITIPQVWHILRCFAKKLGYSS